MKDKHGHFSGAPNDGFLSDPLKRYFRPSGVQLKLCRFILGSVRYIFICSVNIFINPKTLGLKFSISRKLEVKIPFRKS